MNKSLIGIATIILILQMGIISDVYAHPLFNSQGEIIGDYRVSIATDPEIPGTGQEFKIMLKVDHRETYEEVNQFKVGIRIFFDGKQIDAIPPKLYKSGHTEFNYILDVPGNHIMRVDMYDIREDGQPVIYTFNFGSQDPFGIIFSTVITLGSIGLAGLVGFTYIPRIIRSRLKRDS